jgi:hypothetical protein
VEVTGDLEMLNTIQSEVKRLCKKENVVLSILQRDKQDNYNRDFKRIIASDVATHDRCKETPLTQRSEKSSESFKRGWNPILAGFRARSVLSEPNTPMVMQMERSRLPMDLNSATSDGSQRSKSDLASECSDSFEVDAFSIDCPVVTIDQIDDDSG